MPHNRPVLLCSSVNLINKFLLLGDMAVCFFKEHVLSVVISLYMEVLLLHYFTWFLSSFSLPQVKDTVQVDQNVSRHLGEELSRDDWNFLVSNCNHFLTWSYLMLFEFSFVIFFTLQLEG